MWEIPALAIINELRSRGALRDYGPFTPDVTYAPAKAKMWEKGERLKKPTDLRISDFGTRRRHSFLWQRWCVEALKEGLGGNFTGTSNVLLAMDNDLEALGTNAHELPMVLAALAPNEEALKAAPYQVLQDWESYYGGNLKIVLPDAFATDAFLRDAPDRVADWTGFRPDSAPAIEGGETIVAWWKSRGRDPREKLLIFSDGHEVGMLGWAYHPLAGGVRMAIGWAPHPNTRCARPRPLQSHRPLGRQKGTRPHRPPVPRRLPLVPHERSAGHHQRRLRLPEPRLLGPRRQPIPRLLARLHRRRHQRRNLETRRPPRHPHRHLAGLPPLETIRRPPLH